MFTPLVPIKIDSIYNGLLPARMAKCTPDMYASIFALKQQLQSLNSDLVLSDLFRSYEMQLQSYQDYKSGKKSAFSPPPGGSMHEAGRAFDLDLKFIKKMGLPAFWPIAAAHGLRPIIKQPDIHLSEAWHFDCRGSHQIVYDYYAAGHGDNFKSPYTAMAASAILSIGQKVDALGEDVLSGYVQSALIRLGQNIGDLDGRKGPQTRTALAALQIDPDSPIESIADSIDKKLQEKFPAEFFVPGAHIESAAAPDHLVVDMHALAAAAPPSGKSASATYRPNPATLPHLGSIADKLKGATAISQTFVHPPALIARLPSGALYFDSNLELDTDGWPGGNQGDSTWQSGTSLRYPDDTSINANEVPFFVLPLPTTWPTQYGISLGDYAVVFYKQFLAFAVFADFGPKNKLGEGSIQLLRQLGQERIKNGRVINAGMGPGIITVVFPGSGAAADRANQATLVAAINKKGPALLAALQAAPNAA